jgi:hypothetical protein
MKKRRRNPGSAAFNVYLKGRHVDTVFFDGSFTSEEVRQALIRHDGYSPSIKVRKSHAKHRKLMPAYRPNPSKRKPVYVAMSDAQLAFRGTRNLTGHSDLWASSFDTRREAEAAIAAGIRDGWLDENEEHLWIARSDQDTIPGRPVHKRRNPSKRKKSRGRRRNPGSSMWPDATRYIGDAKIVIGWNDAKDAYEGYVKVGKLKQTFSDLHGPRSNADSAEAYDTMAVSIVGFLSYYTTHNRGDDLPDWAPPADFADALEDAIAGASDEEGRGMYLVRRTKSGKGRLVA